MEYNNCDFVSRFFAPGAGIPDELNLTDAGALEVPFGNLSSLLTVTGGTGDYAHSTGYLNIFGATYSDGTAKGKFEGMICK